MPAELRELRLENIHDAIRLINESSRGTSIESGINTIRFLWLSRYWNFSYEHSLIRYVNDEPAALMINCTDPEALDAYTFYWGALPKFRTPRISLPLFEACCNKLHDDGYTTLYGDSVPDRPVRRYRFVEAMPENARLDMETASPVLPAADVRYSIRSIDADVASRVALPPGELLHWCQRPTFIHNAAPFLHFLGAFAGDALKAYMVVLPDSTNTALLDIRSAESSFAAGYELLRWLLGENCCPPFRATYVLPGGYAHALLLAAGFAVKREFSTLRRDLRATRPSQSVPA